MCFGEEVGDNDGDSGGILGLPDDNDVDTLGDWFTEILGLVAAAIEGVIAAVERATSNVVAATIAGLKFRLTDFFTEALVDGNLVIRLLLKAVAQFIRSKLNRRPIRLT